MKNKTILVTGGAGYIGSHMLQELRKQGCSIIAFDNLSRGHRDAVGDSILIHDDLLSQNAIDACFEKYNIDLVIHFAAFAYVGESVDYPEIYYRNNINGTLNLLSSMLKHQVDKIVFSSSCAIYGEPDWVPITEEHPKKPINPYGHSKLIIEEILLNYAKAYGLQSISLRYFNVAGCDSTGVLGERHDPETHLIPLVLSEALILKKNEFAGKSNLNVFGNSYPTQDGSCIRDYIHVEDLCNAHLLASKRLFDEKTKGAEYYNLSNGVGFSVFEIINSCRKVTKQNIQFNILPPRKGDPAILIGNAKLANKILGWAPKYTSIDKIVETAWMWMNK